MNDSNKGNTHESLFDVAAAVDSADSNGEADTIVKCP
jgi:hypothetical protein